MDQLRAEQQGSLQQRDDQQRLAEQQHQDLMSLCQQLEQENGRLAQQAHHAVASSSQAQEAQSQLNDLLNETSNLHAEVSKQYAKPVWL